MTTTFDRQSITYRLRRDDDQQFLFLLYASTRLEEMQMLEWTNEQKHQFLVMQFLAQTAYYDEQFDADQFFIIERDGQPIGRLYLEYRPGDIHIVDISLLPEVRGQGIGGVLLQEILDEAVRDNLTVTIYVEHYNPAMHLYLRLGFRHVDTNGVYHIMNWTAPAQSAT